MFSKNIAHRLANIATQFSERNAFCINGVYHTYGEFWTLVSKIRTGLMQIDLEDNKIGLVANDDLETYASIFAIWMEGKAYVPLHPKFPIDRNLDVIQQAGLLKVLDSSITSEYDDLLVAKTEAFKSNELTTEIKEIPEEALAYILYTSGSTGKPKGVQISYKNLDNFVSGYIDVGFDLDENDKCLQCFDLTFDVSVQSFLIPLIHGASVYTVPHDQVKYSYIFNLLIDKELTFGVFSPSILQLLKPYFSKIDLKKLRYCALVAEASPVKLIEEWSKCIPNARIINCYGPTEATIYCVYYEVKPNQKIKGANGLLAIGRPSNGVEAVILDDDLKVAEKGVKGELCVSGPQVTRGYLNNPERNKEAFVTINYNGTNQKFYKTGDLCLEDADNDILYHGRLDNQVKIQGFRIELGEIEFHARAAIGGKNAIAFVYKGKAGTDKIAICLEAVDFNKDVIFSALKAILPPYMMPSKIYSLEKFPLNTSDKIDRKKVIAMVS